MNVVSSWTGARAHALQQALRMTNEAFAEHLGAAVRTVTYWRSRPDCSPQPVNQEALDTVLAKRPSRCERSFG
jgi:DNA-binding transcriptional regulator YiaG